MGSPQDRAHPDSSPVTGPSSDHPPAPGVRLSRPWHAEALPPAQQTQAVARGSRDVEQCNLKMMGKESLQNEQFWTEVWIDFEKRFVQLELFFLQIDNRPLWQGPSRQSGS